MQYLVSIALAVVCNMVLGFLWYGPFFGRQWLQALGWSEKELAKRKAKGMGMVYALTTAGAVVTAVMLSAVIRWYGAPSVGAGIAVGFFVWLGFILPISAQSVLFEGRNNTAFWIGVGYQLAALMLTGAILALGQPARFVFY